jgi:tRNA-Thr(GGU) m(6)t(6)A37 methyltransferase TsaA
MHDVEVRDDQPSPTYRHLDDADVPWQRVKVIRKPGGTEAAVWEKWLAFSDAPPYLTLYARYDPGMIVRRHGHHSPHVVFVLEGSLQIGDRACPAGTHVELPLGAAFGPLVAGPDGAVLFEVMMGDPRSWGDDRDAFAATLDEHGATALPDPPLSYPDWLVDLRGSWAGEGQAPGGDDAGAKPVTPVVMVPVGHVRGGRAVVEDDEWGAVEAVIELDPRHYGPESLAGLGEFSHADVAFVFDQVTPGDVVTGARHPRGRADWPEVGIFAQRAKNRPNRIGLSTCEILSVTGTTVRVRGLDAVDGTPVLDIKPHVALMGPRTDVRQPPWMSELMRSYW